MKRKIVILLNIILFSLILTLVIGNFVCYETQDYTSKEKILGKHITNSESGTPYYFVITENGEQNVTPITYMSVDKNDFLYVIREKTISKYENINFDKIFDIIFKIFLIYCVIFLILRFTWLKEVEHFLN